MKKLLAVLVVLPGILISGSVFAAASSFPLDEMDPDISDQASLQRGARTFVNYCLGCHSLKYQRYQRTADDIGIPHDMMVQHMVFNPADRIGSLMDTSMSVKNAKQWFGAAPPDLTMYTQLKGGPEYFYTYMRNFYEDKNRPFGVNNLLFENVGMPHVLLDLQGMQQKVCKQVPQLAENGGERRDPLSGEPITEKLCGDDLVSRGYSPLELVEGTGQLTPDEYDQVVYDLTNFLYYTSDPSRLERERIGVYVLLFLAFFYVITFLLGREYTKEFH
jgi:cytochrome c1